MLENFLKMSGWTDIIISILFILFGIILISNPEVISSMISIILGGICIIMGILKLIDYFASGKTYKYLLSIALIGIISGIIIMFLRRNYFLNL